MMTDELIAISVRETPTGWFIIFQEQFIGPYTTRSEAIKAATRVAAAYAESRNSYVIKAVGVELPNKELMP